MQERGLYFLGDRDPKYTDLVELADPFEFNKGPKRGALVDAQVGRGHWVYVGLNLWRQLPAGTDGAYKLLANLVSLGRGDGATRPRAVSVMAIASADVLVVGGGPAGATAARALALAGRRVQLLDRARFPRNKPCGGAISMRALKRFPYLEPSALAHPTHAALAPVSRSAVGDGITLPRARPRR